MFFVNMSASGTLSATGSSTLTENKSQMCSVKSRKQKMTAVDFSKVCRTCMGYSNTFTRIFSPVDDGKVSEMIVECLSIQVTENDGLPQQLCEKCFQNLRAFLTFRQTSRDIQEVLRGKLLESSDVKTEARSGDGECEINGCGNKEKQFVCIVCGKPFAWQSNLSAHLRLHGTERSYSCNICQKLYKNMKYLKSHQTYVHKPKVINCEKCEKKFSRPSSLAKHVKNIHEELKPFLCSFCGKKFAQKALLKSHLIVHTLEKNHSCDICGKSFGRKPTLDIHKRHHTGEKPYKCSICGKSFASTSERHRHGKFHADKREFACNVCGKTFNIKRHLTEHMVIHTGERPFKCEFCFKSFMKRKRFEVHVFRVHKNGDQKLKSQVKLVRKKKTNYEYSNS